MSLPTIEEITNLYLYGSPTKPSNLESDVLLRADSPIVYGVDINEYMDSVGRFVSAANFAHVGAFLTNALGVKIPPGSYNEDQILAYYGLDKSVKSYGIKQYDHEYFMSITAMEANAKHFSIEFIKQLGVLIIS